MQRVARRLEANGYVLYSGACDGADKAFSAGCTNKVEFIPWKGFQGNIGGIVCVSDIALQLASNIHPNWAGCSKGARKLHARNCHQILGLDLRSPVDFVVCWTQDGAEVLTTSRTGGTGQAIRLANKFNIPVFNLYNSDAIDRIKKYLDSNN